MESFGPAGWGKNPLFGVSNAGRVMFVVEARNLEEAELRAHCVAKLYEWPGIDGNVVAQVQECPRGTPAFLEAFFAPTGLAGALLLKRKMNMH